LEAGQQVTIFLKKQLRFLGLTVVIPEGSSAFANAAVDKRKPVKRYAVNFLLFMLNPFNVLSPYADYIHKKRPLPLNGEVFSV